ncbi:hypothetical protein CEN45_08740 [Fischerella thermalis CCMEE 5198]|jgi:hypothetical protein|uniref:Glutathione S-transferase n=1 Tax=Fischerella thermalis JSC-11 TaxID=741277 RepID=G6FTI7_9CYAN|nr:hypothetical protein [Fischerella thermalis]PLZ77658.1 hypothetical protein CBP16_20880 [Fischerella thermalis WC217]PLZ87768.1 hypothetical protein CI594_21015 [Fischerella thermalis CCMEE 5196]PMB09554.1 hypothetical protein CI592_06120 [Fischerella thermalis CCMEE 5328]PMB44055.1 hypothetical protein CEN40_14700 [Fischerella thermalis CCMEE 5205]PMB52351.1 hypothetical protein CEN39_10355 [Fischerella thermalis CCMEE 5201]RDH48552.1 hypothetical protein CBF18_19120 [Mastigocladus lamino
MKYIKYICLTAISSIVVSITNYQGAIVAALPPAEDIPEEILRTEIILAARSPIDGKPLSAADYAQLQAQLQQAPPPKLSSNIRDNIFLLRLRKALLQLFPFLDTLI